MVTAIILIRTERTAINNVAVKLAELEGISEAYSVSGSYVWWPLPVFKPMTTLPTLSPVSC